MTATGFLRRSIADQTGNAAFALNVTLSNSSGICNFGLSGGITLNYLMQSGKIYDNSSNFIGSYTPGLYNYVSGVVAPTTHDLYLDSQPVYFGQPKPTGKINYFYINPQNVSATYDLFVKGTLPVYTNSTSITFITGQSITGSFTDSNAN